MKEEVIVEVDEEGVVTYEVSGIKGQGCKALTAELDRALGGGGKSTPTKELYEKPLSQKEQHRA
jgi:hypothetical protein